MPYAIPSALGAHLAVWGASGQDEADRPGEIRIPLELSNVERPAAARDGPRLIEPLTLRADSTPGVWLVSVRVRNESTAPSMVAALHIQRDPDCHGLWSAPLMIGCVRCDRILVTATGADAR